MWRHINFYATNSSCSESISEEIRPIIVEMVSLWKSLKQIRYLLVVSSADANSISCWRCSRFIFVSKEKTFLPTIFASPTRRQSRCTMVFCSLRNPFSCPHEHPGKFVYRVFQPLRTFVTQFQFWLRNVCSFRHRITNKNWSLWRPSDVILALKKTESDADSCFYMH